VDALWHAETAAPLKSTSGRIQDGGRRPNLHFLNRYNSAADCSVSFKLGREFDHVTADTLQTFKVKGSKVKVTEWKRYESETIGDWLRTWYESRHYSGEQLARSGRPEVAMHFRCRTDAVIYPSLNCQASVTTASKRVTATSHDQLGVTDRRTELYVDIQKAAPIE